MIILYNEEKVGPYSLLPAVNSVSPVPCPRLLKGYAKFELLLLF